MPRFDALPGSGVRLRLERDEAELLRRLIGEMRGLLRESPERTDPVINRLFPEAYESPEDEEAYRELVGDDLHTEKLQALDEVEEMLGPRGKADVHLDADRVGGWLAMLTDLRLAIGTRLEVDEEQMASEPRPDDPKAPAMSAMHWLGWIQEGILQKLMDTEE